MAVRRKYIRELVENLLEKFGVKNPPVPVIDIVKKLGIELDLQVVDNDLSGFLVRHSTEGKAVIGANSTHSGSRQRFTIAHELGHFLLHEGEVVHVDEAKVAYRVNLRNIASSMGDNDEEKEANFFAAELLMPARFIKRDMKSADFDLLADDKIDEPLRKMAERYQVSVQALSIRLSHLEYVPM